MAPGAGGAAFKILYPLAFLGAHLAFMPLLLLLLPRRVERLFPAENTTVLSILLIVGAVTASLAHVAAGHASDKWVARHGQRRVPIAVGLALLAAAYAGLAAAMSLAALTMAMIAFQIALNLMFAPLGALLSDHVADRSKARTAASLTLALPVSIALCGPIAAAFPSDGTAAFVLVIALVSACVVPLLAFWPAAATVRSADTAQGRAPAALAVSDFRRAWIARFLVQCGAALIIFYLYIYLSQLPASADVPSPLSRAISVLVSAGGLTGVAAAFAMGRISDRLQQRRWPVAASGALAAGGLLLLALQPAWPFTIIAYALFSAGLMAFLSVDSAMIAQMLGSHPARGRWLGIMNLTNTLPAIVTPVLTLLALQVASGEAITFLLGSAAFATALGAVLILRMSSVP